MRQKIVVTSLSLPRRSEEQKNALFVVARKKRENVENKLFI